MLNQTIQMATNLETRSLRLLAPVLVALQSLHTCAITPVNNRCLLEIRGQDDDWTRTLVLSRGWQVSHECRNFFLGLANIDESLDHQVHFTTTANFGIAKMSWVNAIYMLDFQESLQRNQQPENPAQPVMLVTPRTPGPSSLEPGFSSARHGPCQKLPS